MGGRQILTAELTVWDSIAAVTMFVNGAKAAEGRLTNTIPLQISLGEGMDIGEDAGSPVDFTYKLPFLFTGKIEKVTFELK